MSSYKNGENTATVVVVLLLVLAVVWLWKNSMGGALHVEAVAGKGAAAVTLMDGKNNSLINKAKAEVVSTEHHPKGETFVGH